MSWWKCDCHCWKSCLTAVKSYAAIKPELHSLMSSSKKWASSGQNQQSGMCAQRRLSSAWASTQSDQSSLCAQWVVEEPNFLHADSGCPGWSEFLLGEHAILLVMSWSGSNITCIFIDSNVAMYLCKAVFPRAKFLCHISHALQSLLTDFCGIITVNLYSRTDSDEKWISNNYNFGINDCGACNLWQRKFGRVLEPLESRKLESSYSSKQKLQSL